MLSHALMCFAPMISNPKMVNSIRGFLVMRLFKSCMTAFAVKSSCAKWKKTASSLVIASLFCILMNSVGLSAGAIDPADTVTLSADMWRGICGPNNTINVYYLATDMTYKSATMSYISTQAIRSVDCSGLPSSAYAGREIVFYTMHAPADFYLPAFSSGVPNVIVSLDLHFQNVTYFDFAYVNPIYNKQDWQSSYNSISASQLSEWAFIQAGDSISDIHSIPARANSGSPAICINNNHPSELQGFCPSIDEGNFPDYYVGDVSFAPALTENRGDLYLGLVCPVVNSGYIYIGHDIPPPAPTTTNDNSGSGSGGGVITTDASGNTGFQYTVTMQFPQYIWSGSFAQNTDLFPVTVSALASGLDDYGTIAASALSALADDADIDGLWECADYFLPAGVVLLIMGCSSVSLAGWILNRYS